jgi:hypothetical protein
MIFAKRFRSESHVREFVVNQGDERGWEIREEEDDQIVRRVWIQDWHRVESAILRFGLQAMQLERTGWVEVPAHS